MGAQPDISLPGPELRATFGCSARPRPGFCGCPARPRPGLCRSGPRSTAGSGPIRAAPCDQSARRARSLAAACSGPSGVSAATRYSKSWRRQTSANWSEWCSVPSGFALRSTSRPRPTNRRPTNAVTAAFSLYTVGFGVPSAAPGEGHACGCACCRPPGCHQVVRSTACAQCGSVSVVQRSCSRTRAGSAASRAVSAPVRRTSTATGPPASSTAM